MNIIQSRKIPFPASEELSHYYICSFVYFMDSVMKNVITKPSNVFVILHCLLRRIYSTSFLIQFRDYVLYNLLSAI